MLQSPLPQIDKECISPKKTILLTWDSASAERWAESLYLDWNVGAVNPEIFLSGQKKKKKIRKEILPNIVKHQEPDADASEKGERRAH